MLRNITAATVVTVAIGATLLVALLMGYWKVTNG